MLMYFIKLILSYLLELVNNKYKVKLTNFRSTFYKDFKSLFDKGYIDWKRKIVHSYRRIYCSNFILGDGKEKVNFLIFRDKDIGVYEYWQAHIHENYKDEDVETEDDQKKLAGIFVLGEIKEAFSVIKNRNVEDIFVNFYRYNKFRSNEENERINMQILNLKNSIIL